MAKTIKRRKTDKAPAAKKATKTIKTAKHSSLAKASKDTKNKAGKKGKRKETPIIVPETVFQKKKSKKNKNASSKSVISENKIAINNKISNGEGSFGLAEAVIKGLQDIKGKKIVWLNLSHIENAVADHFIICEAESTIQVNALGRSVEEIVKQDVGEKPWHSEGKQNAQWILIDYVSVVVHIFQTEVREFYNLEALWADAEVMEIELVQ